jgi:hypothetical protein
MGTQICTRIIYDLGRLKTAMIAGRRLTPFCDVNDTSSQPWPAISLISFPHPWDRFFPSAKRDPTTAQLDARTA